MTTQIIGTGSFLPETVVTNDDLATHMETSDEWIFSRTGIKERRLVKEETTAMMATQAALQAMKQADILAEEIDLIIVGTITNDDVTPSTACRVQANLGAKNAVAFDINAACSGFMFSLHTAHLYLQAGISKKALVIGTETLSRIMDWQDRGTCVLFGDGAGAAVLQLGEKGLYSFNQGSDGESGKYLTCKNRENNNILVQNNKQDSYVEMDGQKVYKFAVTVVPESIVQVLEENHMGVEDIDYFVLHQANLRIIHSVAKRLKVSVDKFPISLDHCGNVSAGSVPILLDEMNQKGMLKKGNKIILSGFGGGLTWGTALLEWV